MKLTKSGIMMLSMLSVAAMFGCSSSTKEGGNNNGGDIAKVGDTACFQCHAGTADPLTGDTFITQYKRSLHAELGCESCHGGGSQHNGIGPFPYELNSKTTDAQKAERCAMCHNGTDAPLSSSINFMNGNHANPFSAEEAHEAKCARCHSHEGSILYGKDGYTGDQTILNNTAYQPVLARDPETFNTIKCATCHEHGGNLRQFKTRNLAGDIVTWDPNGNKVNDQIDLCTSCHTMTTNEGKLIGSGNDLTVGSATVPTAPYYHNTRWFRTLPSTHYDQPATGAGTIIEGYNIRKVTQTKNPCFDCHGHEFKANTRALADRPERGTTTFTDWAQSGHAGQLLTQKLAAAAGKSGTAQVDAVMTAGATEASGAAWVHYDWDASNRASCQRCHTATGASNFMKNPSVFDENGKYVSGYDPTQTFKPTSTARNARLNSYPHLTGWNRNNTTGTVTSSGQNEVLYCWGCHQNPGTGMLFAPGARKETYTPSTTGDVPVTIQYPDIAGSNVCMTCHVGREVGETIKNDGDADGVRGFINSHYLTAGAQLFAKSGYTFAGKNYDNPSFFAHDKIGTAGAPGTGSNGPCVGCHMTSKNKHKFTNVSTSGGVITAITSPLCATCHTGQFALTPESLTKEEEEYNAALSGLSAALATKAIYFYSGANPYFFTAPYVVGGTNTSYTNWAGPYGFDDYKNTMGAAFNLNLLAHDPGGFAHNRYYAKRLIWDSIDFIDDGVLNNSPPTTLAAVLTGQELTDAQEYLGTTRP